MNSYIITAKHRSFPGEVVLIMHVSAASADVAVRYFNAQLSYPENWHITRTQQTGVNGNVEEPRPHHHSV